MIKDICIEFNLSFDNISFDLVIRSKNLQAIPYSCYLRFSDPGDMGKILSAFKKYLSYKDSSIFDSLVKDNESIQNSVKCLHVEITTKKLIEKVTNLIQGETVNEF